MTTAKDFVRMTIGLSSNPSTVSKFTIPLLLVDHADVPVDKRFRKVSSVNYDTRLTADSEAHNWYSQFYAQPEAINNRNTVDGYVGRWVSAAIAPYRVFPNAEDAASVWAAALAAGKFNIDDGTNDEDIAVDTTGATDMQDVADAFNVGFVASTNFKTYVCSIDSLDRMIITGPVAGASGVSFALDSPATGTDLTSATYLGNATSFLQAGLDAETLGAAANAVFALDNGASVLFQRGASAVQKYAFIVAMNPLDKFVVLTDSDTEAEDSESTTTIGYQVVQADVGQKCQLLYTSHGDYSDAAAYGEIAPQDEGTVNFALTPFNGVSISGLAVDGVTPAHLGESEAAAVVGFGYDYFVKPINDVHLVHGLCPSGDEVRIVLNKLFTENNITLEGYAYLLAQKVVVFRDLDINAFKGIIEKWLDLSVERLCIAPGYVLDMPLAEDFTAAQKQTHNLELKDLTDAALLNAVNTVEMSLTWSTQ